MPRDVLAIAAALAALAGAAGLGCEEGPAFPRPDAAPADAAPPDALVDETPPQVAFVSPTDDARVMGQVPVVVTATDDSAVAQVVIDVEARAARDPDRAALRDDLGHDEPHRRSLRPARHRHRRGRADRRGPDPRRGA